MKRAWKWILGVLGVILLCVLVAGIGFLFTRGHANVIAALQQPNSAAGPSNPWRMPLHRQFTVPGAPDGQRNFGPGMYPRRLGARGGFRPSPFGLPFMLVGGFVRIAFPLALIALVGVGAYFLGRNAGRRAVPASATPPSPVVEAKPKPSAESTPPAEEAPAPPK
jgi:hypothetical protein